MPSRCARARCLLGTLVSINAWGSRERVEPALDAAFGAIARVHELMSFHDPASDVARLNRGAHRQPVAVDPWTHQVLAAANGFSRDSGGAFDISIAPALVDRGRLPAPGGAEAPGREAGASHDRIELLDGDRVAFAGPLWIDLGGIAKGFAVDMACAALQSAGLRDYVVNAGGDLRIGEEGHEVHVRVPASPGCTAPFAEVAGGAVATSAHYDDEPLSIIDPASGEFVVLAGSVTVTAHHCMSADALTKVAAVAPAAAAAIAERIGAAIYRLGRDGQWQVATAATACASQA